MKLYKIVTKRGSVIYTPELEMARINYCNGRLCRVCRLASADSNKSNTGAVELCHECDDAELLRRFGAEIEICDLVPASDLAPASDGITHKRSNEALRLFGDAQRALGVIEGAVSGIDETRAGVIYTAIETMDNTLTKWRDMK